jgi:hypothetical protein
VLRPSALAGKSPEQIRRFFFTERLKLIEYPFDMLTLDKTAATDCKGFMQIFPCFLSLCAPFRALRGE